MEERMKDSKKTGKPLFSQAQERVEKNIKELMKKKKIEHEKKLQKAKEKEKSNK
jgi:hypothetical protein